MSDQLLPCPFCGTSHLLGFEKCPDHGWTMVKCRKCGVTGPAGRSETELEAAAHWNRRATQPAAGEPVEAKEIGEMTITLRDGVKCFSFEEYSEAYKLPEGLHYLYAAPPAAAHGDEAVTNLVPGLQWAIDYCNAMQRQGNERMLVEVIRKRLENVRDNQPAAMRAQGDDRLLFTDAIMPGGLTET